MNSPRRLQRWQQFAGPAAATMTLVVIGAIAVPLLLLGPVPESAPADDRNLAATLLMLPAYLSMAVVGIVLLLRRPANPVGWLVAALPVVNLLQGAGNSYLIHQIYGPTSPGPWAVAAGLLTAAGNALTAASLIQLFLIFPDGHVPSRRWWVIVWLNAATAALGLIAAVTDPAAITDGHVHLPNPIASTGIHGALSAFIGGPATLVGLLLAGSAVSLVVRYLRSGSETRHQLKWFVVGVAIFLIGLFAGGFLNWPKWAVVMANLGFVAVPVAIAIAVLKYRLYDIDVVINRALVYGSLAAFIGAAYVGIAVGIGSLVGSGGKPNLELSILATALVAIGFQPLRERLQKLANRLVYGRRASPYEVLSEFSSRVAESFASEEVLGRMARVLAEGTGAEEARVWLRGGDQMIQAAAWPTTLADGEPASLAGELLPDPPAQHVATVRHQGELLGALTVSKRKGESLTPIEEKLLEDLAHQAGLVLKNVGLTEDLRARLVELRASRQRLVAAQDQERRRLERNLHDGAQQHLVALKVKLGLVEVLAQKDLAKARATVTDLKRDADEALETLRDFARGIYPPLLAEQGLAAALQAQARRATLPVEVSTQGLGRYPQEVESAVYFCCLEALQNVQKYAQAVSATIHLAQEDGHLEFEVEDDGRGFDPVTVKRGSGLTNIEDRLDALGGTLSVLSAADRGTRLIGRVPVPVAARP